MPKTSGETKGGNAVRMTAGQWLRPTSLAYLFSNQLPLLPFE